MGECVNQITVKVCKITGQMCSFAGREQDCPNHKVDCGGENVPTFGQWLNIWWDAAEKRLEDRGSDNRRFLNTRRNDLLQSNKDRLFAMFMFRFAVRNGDVTRLRWSNIENINGRLRLRYTPNKTHLTSEREVKAWMDNEMDVADLRQYRIECGNPPDDAFIFGGGKCQELQDRLCAELRAIGLEGSKALYWLRKICLTELYKRKGREAVYALSGDNTDEILFGHYVPRGSYEVSVEDME